MFCFAGPPPVWYEAVVEPNPAVVSQTLSKESITELFDDIVRHQVDLLVLAVTLRQDIDDALARRDRAAFEKLAPVYREVVNRCVLWDFWRPSRCPVDGKSIPHAAGLPAAFLNVIMLLLEGRRAPTAPLCPDGGGSGLRPAPRTKPAKSPLREYV